MQHRLPVRVRRHCRGGAGSVELEPPDAIRLQEIQVPNERSHNELRVDQQELELAVSWSRDLLPTYRIETLTSNYMRNCIDIVITFTSLDILYIERGVCSSQILQQRHIQWHRHIYDKCW